MSIASRLALVLVLALPVSARAQGVSPESAQSLQDQLHAWIAGMVGPGVNPGMLTPHVTPEGDHYRVALPISGLASPGEASAQLQPLDNGRWGLQHIAVPSSMRFDLAMPEKEGGPTALNIEIGGQDSHAVIDPALQSRSSLTVDLSKLVMHSEGSKQQSEQRIGHYAVSASLQPNGDGTLDFDEHAELADWSSASSLEGRPAVAFGADRLTANGRITGLDRAQAGVLLSAVSGLIATLPKDAAAQAGKAPLTPEQRVAVRRLVEGLRGIITNLRGEEDIEGMHVAIAGVGEGAVKHVHIGMGGDAPQGMLQGWMEIALNGLAIADLPPEAAALTPHHIELHPSVHGVPVEPLLKLALDATQPGADQAALQAEAEGLLSHGGVTVALDSIGFDLGPTVVHGTGHVLVTGPDQYAAEAHLTATGLDALMDKARTDPMLQQAIPVLIMLRGFAKQEGQQLVWNVVAQGGTVTVNGIEVVKPHPPGNDHPPPPAKR